MAETLIKIGASASKENNVTKTEILVMNYLSRYKSICINDKKGERRLLEAAEKLVDAGVLVLLSSVGSITNRKNGGSYYYTTHIFGRR